MPTYALSYERQDGEGGPWSYCSLETVVVEAAERRSEDLRRMLEAHIRERYPNTTELRNLRWRWCG